MPTHRRSAPRPESLLIELWSLRQDALLELPDEETGGAALLITRWGDVRLPHMDTVVSTALERMSYGPISLDNVVPGFSSPGGTPGPEETALRQALDSVQNVVVRSLAMADGRPLLSVVPISRSASFRPRHARADAVHRLSRFALLRAGEDGLCIESPLSEQRVILHRLESAWLAASFALPSTPEEVARSLRMPLATVQQALGYLTASGMLVRESAADDTVGERYFPEDRDPTLIPWSPYDLMLHTRSRPGRHDEPIGATYAYAELLEADPVTGGQEGGVAPSEGLPMDPEATRTLPPGPVGPVGPVGSEHAAAGGPYRIALPVPDLDQVLEHDPPFTVVLEARRSVRDHDERPLELARLGELLFRSARVRAMTADPVEGPHPVTDRPYPGAGGVHPLELYLTVSNCAELPRGSYRYDPTAHALIGIGADARRVDEMLGEAMAGAGLAREPAVLITMTASFHEMTCRYSGMAYTAVLKEVGALQQTLYLVCTAMGLAPCALAASDGDLSARAFGLDWRAESGVGEFVVGVLPDRLSDAASAPGTSPAAARRPVPAAVATEPVQGADWRWRSIEVVRRLRRTTGHRRA